MKRAIKIVIVFLVVLSTTTLVYAISFPQPVRCLLIDFYDFEHTDRLYYRSGISEEKMGELLSVITQAEQRVASFWNGRESAPIIIYCETDEDYMKFGSSLVTPAAAILTFNSYVILSKEGVDLDIISHELAHTELSKRIGFFGRQMKIPTWFDEGLAMQVDHRPHYSIDSLKKKSNNFKELKDVTKLTSNAKFMNGTREEVMLSYLTAKYIVGKWHTPEMLDSFIDNLNEGKSFHQSYSSLE